MDGLRAALTRLKRMVMGVEGIREDDGKAINEDIAHAEVVEHLNKSTFENFIVDDLNTPMALIPFEETLVNKRKLPKMRRLSVLEEMDKVLGLNLLHITRTDLRIRPKTAQITEEEIEGELLRRKEARLTKDFATSDAIRDELAAKGVELMDGDPLEWEWKL